MKVIKMIKRFEEFIFENREEIGMNELLDRVSELPSHEILKFREELRKMVETDSGDVISNDELGDENQDQELEMNEGFTDWLSRLKRKFSSWLDDKLFKYLINRKKDFYLKIIDKLSVFDLTTLDDVVEVFPGFKVESLYLAGGMDDAKDGGAGWRNVLEWEFEKRSNGRSQITEPVKIGDKMIQPKHVIDGDYLNQFLENPNEIQKMYSNPTLLNPVRKEVERTETDNFSKSFSALRDPNYDPNKNVEPFDYFRKSFTTTIEPDDEHLLRISSAVFLGMDPSAGAGTYGELQLLSMIRKPLFAWLVNGHEGNVGAFKLWNIPHLTKVARNKEEMKTLVSTMLRYT
jgi:hypothetical protein